MTQASPTVPSATETASTVVSRLHGGLGNQLFQLAFAKAMARLLQGGLAFDVSAYRKDSFGREQMLHRIEPGAALLELASLRGPGVRRLREQDFKLPPGCPFPTRHAVDPGVSHLVLFGYWQDHRFVQPWFVEDLRQHLNTTLEPAVGPLAERIRSAAHPVAVHVRRHDYRHHGLCSDQYYLDALRWFARRDGELDVFVFSDEPNATTAVLQDAGVVHRLVHGSDPLADLYLMSQCRTHVIANSTFSWWGAALSGSDDVVCPAEWSLLKKPSQWLCPAAWRKVGPALERPQSMPSLLAELDREQARIAGPGR